MFLSISRSTLHPAVLYSESESGLGVEDWRWVGRLVEGRWEVGWGEVGGSRCEDCFLW